MREFETLAKKKANKGTFNWLNAAAENGMTKKINEEIFQKVETVKGIYAINAGGGISYRYKIFFFGDEGRMDEYT